MDLQQRKLNKTEWTSIEVAVSKDEIDVLNLITSGYHNVNTRINKTNSIFTFLKIEYTEKMEDYLYNKYLRIRASNIEKELKNIKHDYKFMKIDTDITPNSVDRARLERYDDSSLKNADIYEFVLLNHLEKFVGTRINITRDSSKDSSKAAHFHYYTLYKLIRNSVVKLNRHIKELAHRVLDSFCDEINMSVILENGVEFIERNECLLKYDDMMLYDHQKEIFVACKSHTPKLILYMAPTGTGKTLTPIAISEQKRVIFVCAARHVGLALARAAISVKKKVAFAFGCASADDIRLHYFAAKEFTKNKRSGGIGKVDNSVGDEVEIMICDIKSYLPAMYYMLAFFKANDILLYWDEPTITLDYTNHEFHENIHKNWKQNIIPNVVLSSATLPKLHDLTETIPSFLNKFPGSEICNIVSHDCKKTIPIINKDGFVVLPHYLDRNFDNMIKVAEHCENYLTLLRYFDLKEVIEFISYVNLHSYADKRMNINRYFESLDDINMKNIKTYYVKLLRSICKENWNDLFDYFMAMRKPRIFENVGIDPKGNKMTKARSVGPGISITQNKSESALNMGYNLAGGKLTRLASEQIPRKLSSESLNSGSTSIGTSGVYVTTKDAYTLTEGPTIFISNDVEKIAKFCIQQANIPSLIMDDIMKKIEFNNAINERLHVAESNVEMIKEETEKRVKNVVNEFHRGVSVSGRNKSSKDPKKFNRDTVPEAENKGELGKLTSEINSLRAMIKSASLNDAFVPNKKMHLEKWAEGMNSKGAFTSSIDDSVVSDIMALKGVDNSWKILLMMGIGVFINHENITYTEIMKRLADEQKLYMIIASSDYIYGTNYQFCHGYLSKDLNLTQEKIIQAMGRIGRNNIQQEYTVRFRDDQQILKLFTSETEKPEIKNMNILFNTQKIVWSDDKYIELPEDDGSGEDEEIHSHFVSRNKSEDSFDSSENSSENSN
jgi:hypothetical protein